MEAEAGAIARRFFERWIFDSGIAAPALQHCRSKAQEVIVRFEQIGEVYDLPVTVTLQYADKSDEVVPHRGGHEARIPLTATAHRRDQQDHAALGSSNGSATAIGRTCEPARRSQCRRTRSHRSVEHVPEGERSTDAQLDRCRPGSRPVMLIAVQVDL